MTENTKGSSDAKHPHHLKQHHQQARWGRSCLPCTSTRRCRHKPPRARHGCWPCSVRCSTPRPARRTGGVDVLRWRESMAHWHHGVLADQPYNDHWPPPGAHTWQPPPGRPLPSPSARSLGSRGVPPRPRSTCISVGQAAGIKERRTQRTRAEGAGGQARTASTVTKIPTAHLLRHMWGSSCGKRRSLYAAAHCMQAGKGGRCPSIWVKW